MPADKSIADLISNTKKITQRLTLESTNNIVSSTLANPQSQRSSARFRSLQGVGAGAWLDSMPLSTKFALKPVKFHLATRLRLGCEIPLGSVISTCNCGKDVDGDGYHFLTCKTGGGPIWSHETLSSIWSNCLQQLNMTHQREPINRYINTDDRPNIIAFDAQSACNVQLDISVAQPWAKYIISQTALENGAAAAKQEAVKSEKYAGELDMWGRSSNCIALVLNILEDGDMTLFSSLIDCPFSQQVKMEGRTAETSRRTGVAVCLQHCKDAMLM